MSQNELTGTTGAREGAVGFLTDTTLCIGCKACEVACKQWNGLPMDEFGADRLTATTTPATSARPPGGTSRSSSASTGGGARPTSAAAVPEQLADAERRLQALRQRAAAWKPARPAPSSAPSSIPW